jgi:CBS domain-containing protein
MTQRTVRDVMTRDVVAVSLSTPCRQVAGLLAFHGITAVPVVDAERRPVGIVSDVDLALWEELADIPERAAVLPFLDRRLRRHARQKATAVRAEQVMTTPVVTVEAGRSLVDAARLMYERRLRSAPVVDDDGRLVGMVARRDLLRPFALDDEALHLAILTEVLDRLGVRRGAVQVDVVDGVVTLRGRLDRPGQAVAVRRAVEAQPGVVAVVDLLTSTRDGTTPVEDVMAEGVEL